MGYQSPTTTASYAYDALDRRVAKVVDGAAQAFVYDIWNPYRTTANDVSLDFENGLLATRWLHSTSVDEPLGFERYSGTESPGSGIAHEMFADRRGSIQQVVETASNNVVASYLYDGFGKRLQVGGLVQRYGFTARETDGESGLVYFRARHYDPVLGLFVQRDPIGFAGGDLNLYAYVRNDPYGYADPTGLNARALGRGGTGTIAWGILTAGAYRMAASGVGAAYKACLRTPGCRSAGLKSLMEGVGALGEAIGVGAPSGSSPSGTSGDTSGIGTIVSGVLGLVEGIVDYITRMEPGDIAGDDNGGDNGDGDSGDEGQGDDDDPGGDDDYGSDQDAKDSKKIKTDKRANEIAEQLGYENAHDLKDGYGNSEVDIYVNNSSGNVYLIPKNNIGWEWVGNLF